MGSAGHTLEPRICSDHAALCRDAAEAGAVAIRAAIATRGEATIVLATGASQFGTLAALAAAPDIEWDRVTALKRSLQKSTEFDR